VQVREVLEGYLDDDQDMKDMNITAKEQHAMQQAVEAQVGTLLVGSFARAVLGLFTMDRCAAACHNSRRSWFLQHAMQQAVEAQVTTAAGELLWGSAHAFS
jgi:hypothetical protein